MPKLTPRAVHEMYDELQQHVKESERAERQQKLREMS